VKKSNIQILTAFLTIFIFPALLTAVTRESGGAGYVPELCRDLSLAKATAIALKNNPTIDAMTGAVSKSVYIHSAARKEWLPVLSADYLINVFNEVPEMEFGGESFPVSTKNFFMLGVHAKMPIYTGGAIRYRENIERLGIDVSRMRLLEAEADLVQEVTINYFNILLQEDYLKAIKENLVRFENHEQVTQKFFNADLVAKNYLLEIQAKTANARQEYIEAEKLLKFARAALNVSMGVNVDSGFLLKPLVYKKNVPSLPEDCFGLAETNNPSLVVFKYLGQIADKAIDLAKTASRPQVAAQASYYRHGKTFELDNEDYLSNDILLGMITVNWDVFDWFKTKDLTAAKRKELEIIIDQYRALSQRVRLDIKQCYFEMEAAAAKVSAAEKEIEYASENYRISERRYEELVAPSTEVNDALVQLKQAQFHSYNAHYEYNTAIAKLERIIGSDIKAEETAIK